ncbi:MAG: hypothetical protein EAY75_04305 [Bacteroidetes bacterium]|nr:MAG: hypothetical protein EAY75_04305 [Bacteroidota bacterium]
MPHDSVYNHYVQAFNEQPQMRAAESEPNTPHEPYPRATYAAMVSRLDKFVGEIVEAISKKGMLENTLIIFSSDNGPHQEGGNNPAFFNSNGGLTGVKRDLNEGGIRVPLIAMWKGKIKAGSVSNNITAMWDLFPTFQQLSKQNISKDIDGISLLPTLLGRKQKPHKYLYWEFHENGGKQAVRMGKWKAIRLNASTNISGPIALYDLSVDTMEKNNIASQYPLIVQQMDSIMLQAHTPHKNWPFLPAELKSR